MKINVSQAQSHWFVAKEAAGFKVSLHPENEQG